ncbi:MAG: 1-acyl-sn-glycerol-3-phosphate acyltransferase [Phycisphaerae bacterium]|nr:1-acyl-sn-glycerol-3-phosphate acyltransferase [Phycisphaerae bacterium]
MSDTNANIAEEDTRPRPPMPELTKDDRMRPWWFFWRVIARTLYLFVFRGRVLGVKNVPRQGGLLLVSSHQSYFDPVLASLAFDRECHFMAREDLFHSRKFARFIASLNAFPVRRNSADMRAIKETLRRLKKGRMILVFPEGTRTPDGRIGGLQPGVASIAKQAKVTVVPTLIEGAYNVWPRHARVPRPARIIVKYGKPIFPDEIRSMTKTQLMERLDQTLRQMQADVRRTYHLPPLPGTEEHRRRTERSVAPDFGRGWHFGFVAERLFLRTKPGRDACLPTEADSTRDAAEASPAPAIEERQAT